MQDSSKSNGIKFPGFLPSLQQKAGLSTPQCVNETKDTQD